VCGYESTALVSQESGIPPYWNCRPPDSDPLTGGFTLPVKTRDKLIQSYERAQGALDRALYHMGNMRNIYGEGNKPEHKEAVEATGLMIMQVKEFFQEFRQKHM